MIWLATKVGDAVYADMPRVRLDGGARQFRRRWGYEGPAVAGGPSGSVNGGYALEDIEEDGDDYSDTYSLREEAYNGVVHIVEGKSGKRKTDLLFAA